MKKAKEIISMLLELIRPRTVLEKLIDMLPDVDPDSTRMVEWIWAMRQKHGLDTQADKHTIISANDVNVDIIAKIVKPYFKNVYMSDKYFRGLLESPCGKYIELYVVMVQNDSGDCSICCVGNKSSVSDIMNVIRTSYKRPKSIQIETLIGFSSSGPVTKTYEMSENDIDEPQQCFYPWMEEEIDTLIDKFNASKSNVLLLIGPPGTGKSTLIRKMLFRMNRENIGMIDDANVQANPGISAWVRDFDRDSVIVFEDSDNLVGKREDGNNQMSMLLNLSNGVIYNNTKLIISTNLPSINKVDEALLRPGRNFAILEFRKLNGVEANEARVKMGMEKAALKDDGEYTLAEALAHTTVLEIEKRKANGIGFIR